MINLAESFFAVFPPSYSIFSEYKMQMKLGKIFKNKKFLSSDYNNKCFFF